MKMTKDEFWEHKTKLQKICDRDQRALELKYATEHNPHKIGDVISDHQYTGRIEKIFLAHNWSTREPTFCFSCVRLKKDGTPRKPQALVEIYQSNIIS